MNFTAYQNILAGAEIGVPSLIIDEQALNNNITALKKLWQDKQLQQCLRLVVKSLPCLDLLDFLMTRLNTRALMVFHQEHLCPLGERFGDIDILFGKPMPVAAAAQYYKTRSSTQKNLIGQDNIKWLIDSLPRLEQYLQLARQEQRRLQVVLEIDVGLHRGGVSSSAEMALLLTLIQANEANLKFAGFMGYEAHVASAPPLISSKTMAFQRAASEFQNYIDLLKQRFPALFNELCIFNGGGSQSIFLHDKNSPCNDLSIGSLLLKPVDFEQIEAVDFQTALFIATPILKRLDAVNYPFFTKGLSNLINRLLRVGGGYFIYGGHWLADPVFPQGLKNSALFGYSTNQHLLLCPKKPDLDVDDFIFFRPRQSEFVINQFDELLLLDCRQQRISRRLMVLRGS